LAVVLLRERIPLLYLGDPATLLESFPGEIESVRQTAAFATKFILVAAAFALCDGLQVVASGALRGMSDVKFTSLSSFICYWLVSTPIALPLAYFAGMKGLGIWAGLACGILAAAIVLNTRLFRKLRQAEAMPPSI
jgi:MATE family multidrug resistance protein